MAASVPTCLTLPLILLPTTVRVRITDQGPGVAAERLVSIFEPFERGINEPGSGFGLGLAIASRAVAMHGGIISASNQPSGGLTVEINLPRQIL